MQKDVVKSGLNSLFVGGNLAMVSVQSSTFIESISALIY